MNIEQIIALQGDKYSPNLCKWLKSPRNRRSPLGMPRIFSDKDNALWIGWIDEGEWFIGCRLMRCLTVGSKAEVGCWTFPPSDLTEKADFWADYAMIGRCAIDPAHNGWWQNSDTRWQGDGDVRHCLWCRNHTQNLHRWTEQVERERWEQAA